MASDPEQYDADTLCKAADALKKVHPLSVVCSGGLGEFIISEVATCLRNRTLAEKAMKRIEAVQMNFESLAVSTLVAKCKAAEVQGGRLVKLMHPLKELVVELRKISCVVSEDRLRASVEYNA